MFQDNNQLKCNCGLPVGRRTTWTERNPGGLDEDITEWQRSVTNKLVLEKKLLECQLNTCQTELKEIEMKYKAVLAEMKLQKKKQTTR
ncbi:Keratin type I cytoskeletal 9, partial [Bienertia sinuspersici]